MILAEIGNEVYPVRYSAVPAPANIQSPIKLSEVNSQTLGFQMIRPLINLLEISSQGLQNDRRSTLFIDKPGFREIAPQCKVIPHDPETHPNQPYSFFRSATARSCDTCGRDADITS